MNKAVYTHAELCVLFGKSKRGIDDMIKAGRLPKMLPRDAKKGAPRLWLKSDIDTMLNKQPAQIGGYTMQQQRELEMIVNRALVRFFSDDLRNVSGSN